MTGSPSGGVTGCALEDGADPTNVILSFDSLCGGGCAELPGGGGGPLTPLAK